MTNKEIIKYLIPPIVTSTHPGPEYLKQKEAYELAIQALEQQLEYGDGYQAGYKDGYDKGYDDAKAVYKRSTGGRECMTCKYQACEITEMPCKECSHCWADLYEEADNDEVTYKGL